jgi:hypothetical protein
MMSERDYQVGGTHYTRMSVQPWDVIDQWPIHERVGFYRGNALKYLIRMGTKNSADVAAPLEDAKKAQHYIEKLVDVMEGR